MARRSSTSKRRLGLKVDERARNLSEEALFCRRFGHDWKLQAMTKRRFNELIALGQQEDNRYCANGCESTWRQLWDLRTGEVLENERTYPSGGAYLMPPGSGRMDRKEARVALFARQYPEYV